MKETKKMYYADLDEITEDTEEYLDIENLFCDDVGVTPDASEYLFSDYAKCSLIRGEDGVWRAPFDEENNKRHFYQQMLSDDDLGKSDY